MYILLMIVHVIVCVFLVIVVLLQSGKAADLAGAFGGMGSQTVFGPRGSATVLSKATTIAAALFIKGRKPVSNQQQPAIPQPGQTVPINVTPEVNGQKGPTQTLPVPVQQI